MSANPTARPFACPACGFEHTKCLAHQRRHPELPCGQPPLDGQDVCRLHGGRQPAALKNAAQRIAAADIQVAVLKFGGRIEGISEHEALRQELARTMFQVAWAEQVVSQLNEEELFYGRTMEETEQETGSGTGQREGNTERKRAHMRREARMHAALAYLSERQEHLRRLAVDMVRLGLAERNTAINEEIGHTFAAVMRAVLSDPRLHLSNRALELAPAVVTEHLALVRSAS